MSALVTDTRQLLTARRTTRIPVSKLGQRSKPEPIAPTTASVEVESSMPAATESAAFIRLASKNPVLRDLVRSLDLVEVHGSTVRAEPLPPLVEFQPTYPLNPKLKEIAQRAFARSRVYGEAEAIERLATITDVDACRARNGFSMMLAQGILAPAGTDQYYLNDRDDSTPF